MSTAPLFDGDGGAGLRGRREIGAAGGTLSFPTLPHLESICVSYCRHNIVARGARVEGRLVPLGPTLPLLVFYANPLSLSHAIGLT